MTRCRPRISRRLPRFLYGTAWKEDRTAGADGAGAPDGLPRHRHRQPAPPLLRGRRRPGARRGLPRGARARATICSCRPSSPTRPGRTTGCPTTRAPTSPTQVAQSFASSLEHLGTDHVDSYVLHGPASGYGWTRGRPRSGRRWSRERDAGRTRLLGVSNVSLRQLEQLAAAGAERPAFVQNRCFARRGWDRDVRAFCAEQDIVYQGFSLLTANPEVLHHPVVGADRRRATAPPSPRSSFASRWRSACCRSPGPPTRCT